MTEVENNRTMWIDFDCVVSLRSGHTVNQKGTVVRTVSCDTYVVKESAEELFKLAAVAEAAVLVVNTRKSDNAITA